MATSATQFRMSRVAALAALLALLVLPAPAAGAVVSGLDNRCFSVWPDGCPKLDRLTGAFVRRYARTNPDSTCMDLSGCSFVTTVEPGALASHVARNIKTVVLDGTGLAALPSEALQNASPWLKVTALDTPACRNRTGSDPGLFCGDTTTTTTPFTMTTPAPTTTPSPPPATTWSTPAPEQAHVSYAGLFVGLAVGFALVAFAVVAFWLYRRLEMRRRSDSLVNRAI